jgi:hypothetical protein
MAKSKKSKKIVPVGTEFTFKSRYGETRKLARLSDNKYSLEGSSLYWRCSIKQDAESLEDYEMFDFEGGPYIETGLPAELIEALGDSRTVKKIALVESASNYVKISIEVA